MKCCSVSVDVQMAKRPLKDDEVSLRPCNSVQKELRPSVFRRYVTAIISQTHLSIHTSASLNFLAAATAAPSKIRLADERIFCVILLNINKTRHKYYIRLRNIRIDCYINDGIPY